MKAANQIIQNYKSILKDGGWGGGGGGGNSNRLSEPINQSCCWFPCFRILFPIMNHVSNLVLCFPQIKRS